MLQDAIDAFADIFSPPFRGVMIKSLALTLAVLVLGGFALGVLANGTHVVVRRAELGQLDENTGSQVRVDVAGPVA